MHSFEYVEYIKQTIFLYLFRAILRFKMSISESKIRYLSSKSRDTIVSVSIFLYRFKPFRTNINDNDTKTNAFSTYGNFSYFNSISSCHRSFESKILPCSSSYHSKSGFNNRNQSITRMLSYSISIQFNRHVSPTFPSNKILSHLMSNKA